MYCYKIDELKKIVSIWEFQWLIYVMKKVNIIKRYDDGEREFMDS